jgi:8-oxo-dGTP diphosphatase
MERDRFAFFRIEVAVGAVLSTIGVMEATPYKISTLIYFHNEAGDLLLIERNKAPNKGFWSPIGGKLEMALGESPHEAAQRETKEEIGVDVTCDDLHLFAMISEKHYEDRIHWLMFLYQCQTVLKSLPPPIDEGRFAFIPESAIPDLHMPETDRKILWPLYFERRAGFTALKADCHSSQPLAITIEETIGI